MRIKPNCRCGFTLVEIIIVVAIIGLLAALAIPNFVKSRSRGQQNVCINNLRQIDSAKQQWALESHQPGGVTPTEADIGPYLQRHGSTTNVVCPTAGPTATFATSYNMNEVTNQPTCKIDPSHALP